MNKVSLLLILSVLIVAFQNCSVVDFDGLASEQSFKSNANGENYDGKIFVHADPENPCADQSVTRTVITQTAAGYQLVKKDCALISPPQPVAASDIQIDPDYPARLTYQAEVFVFDSSRITAKPDLECTANNFGPLDSAKIYVVAGSNGPMLVGQVTAFGRTTNMVFEGTNIDTSSASVISGTDQESASYLNLRSFDPTAQLPSNSNTAYDAGIGDIGAEGYITCVRPNGTL